MAQPRDRRGRFASTGGGLAAVAVVAVALASGGGAGTAGSGAAGAAARPGSGSSSQANAGVRDVARIAARLDRLGGRVDQLTSGEDQDCAAHATDQVREFFLEHPCTALFRVRFEIREGPVVVHVAVARVDMPDADQARQYQQVIDAEGTGTVRPLRRDGRRDDTSFDGVAYASVREDVTVVISQAAPVGRTRAADNLAELAVEAATS